MTTENKLLEILIDIVETSRNERHSLYAMRSPNAQRYNEESDSASGESSEEDIDNSLESNQGETIEGWYHKYRCWIYPESNLQRYPVKCPDTVKHDLYAGRSVELIL